MTVFGNAVSYGVGNAQYQATLNSFLAGLSWRQISHLHLTATTQILIRVSAVTPVISRVVDVCNIALLPNDPLDIIWPVREPLYSGPTRISPFNLVDITAGVAGTLIWRVTTQGSSS